MALVRATRFGVDAKGGKVRAGAVFEHAGPLASWMELAETEASPAPSETAAHEQPEAEAQAPESKRNLRNRKVAKGAEE